VRDSVITLLKPNTNLTDTDQEAADLLGSVFSEAYTKEDMTGFKAENDANRMGWQDSSVRLEKEDVLEKLRREKTCLLVLMGYILCSPSRAESVAGPLSLIFQASFESSVVPED